MLPGKTREKIFYGIFTDSSVIQERENSVNSLKGQHLSCFHFRTLTQRLILSGTLKRKWETSWKFCILWKQLSCKDSAKLPAITQTQIKVKIQYISSISTMFTIRVYAYLWSDSGRNWRYTLAVSNTGMSAAFEPKHTESSTGTHINVKLVQLSST